MAATPGVARVNSQRLGECESLSNPARMFAVWLTSMVITSLLDTDLYKFTMMQVVLHHFPAAHVEYRFKCRTPDVNLVPYIDEIRSEIKKLCKLRFTHDELEYLRRMRFIKSDFADFLALFHLNEKCISVEASSKGNGEIEIRIEGPWLHTILFEIPVLAIVNEVYFRNTQKAPDYASGRARLADKIALLGARPELTDCKIADYGTRRRFSKEWHEEVILTLKNQVSEQFAGTSNVYYAKKHGLTPLGTMAHEYLQACQALGPRLRDSQIYGFEMWAKEYRGDLGIALSDVYGMKAFLRDFDMYFCKLFDGARHDSGDPFDWGERLLRHYEENRCDPRTKVLVFSDALDIPKVLQLYERFRGRCRLAFGVGTNLTNDLGYHPLQIVIKMVRCNGQPVAKFSDSPGKNMCDDRAYLAYLRQVFGIETPAEDIEK
jgi:nicotinate phosphoribosyltransferase